MSPAKTLMPRYIDLRKNGNVLFEHDKVIVIPQDNVVRFRDNIL